MKDQVVGDFQGILHVALIQKLQERSLWEESAAAAAEARSRFGGDFNLALLQARAFLHVGLAVAAAAATEAVIQRLRRVPVTLSDGSAVVTGLLVALSLPAGTTAPLEAVFTGQAQVLEVGVAGKVVFRATP